MQLNILFKAYLFFLLATDSGSVIAGIIIGDNKIYLSGKKEYVDVQVRNPGSDNYLLVSRVVSEESRNNINDIIKDKNFIVTPPALYLNGGKERVIRISKADVKNLPAHRESMHFLSITSIPEGKDSGNSVQIAVRTWLRLIYRPEGLTKNKDTQYILQKKGSELLFDNPSPFYIFFSELEVNGKKSDKIKTIPPFRKEVIGECLSVCDVSYSLLNDDGSTGKQEKIKI